MRPSSLWIMLAALAILALVYFGHENTPRSKITYDFFWKQLNADNVAEIDCDGLCIRGRLRKMPEPPPPMKTGETGASGSSDAKREPLAQNFMVTLPPGENPELTHLLNEMSKRADFRVNYQAPAD